MALTLSALGKSRTGGLLSIALTYVALALFASDRLLAEDGSVHGIVRVLHRAEGDSDSGDVVIWLTPVQGGAPFGPGPTVRLLQKNKKFIPHVVAVTQGTEVEFPNQDLYFHNVSSIQQGKTIDLGLYESGAVRKIRFSEAGVSHIFCNIHPQMSAVVVVLRTRYFAQTDAGGNFQINHVPPGRYKLKVWYELTAEQELRSQERELNVTPGTNEITGITLHSSDSPKQYFDETGEPDYSSEMKAH